MAHFSITQKCILTGFISLLCAYGGGNFVVFTGYCCSVALGWFFSVCLLKYNSHLASEWLLDVVTLLKCKYHGVLGKIYGEHYVSELLISKQSPQPKNDTPTQEIKLFIDLILKDFVSSWYDYISDEKQSFEEIEDILEDLSVVCLRKVQALNVHRTAENAIRFFQKHLTEFQEVKKQWQLQPNFRKKGNKDGPEFKKKKNVVLMYKKLEKFHVCLNGDVSEYRYLLVMVDTLLKILLDEKAHNSYIVKELLAEILAVNVIHNVVHLLSDPHFLYKAIILLTSDEKLIIVDNVAAEGTKTEEKCDVVNNAKDGDEGADQLDQGMVREEPDGGCPAETDLKTCTDECSIDSSEACDTGQPVKNSPVHSVQGANKSLEQSFLWEVAENPLFAAFDSLPILQVSNATSTPCSENNANVGASDNYLLGVSPIKPNLPKTNSAPDLIFHSNKFAPSDSAVSFVSEDLNTLDRRRRPSLPLELNETISSVFIEDVLDNSTDKLDTETSPKFFIGPDENELDVETSANPDSDMIGDIFPELRILQQPRPKAAGEGRSESNISDAIEVSRDLEAETHVAPKLLFADISIPKAEPAREAYSNQTYTLYVIEYLAWHKCDDSESWVLKADKVQRRYREFITLQDRLESHPHYKKTIQKIKGPSRWNTLHVGQMQQHRIEGRRQFLQTYLKQLIEKGDVGNSMAVKEFLAYEGDARIAFVMKAREIPRLDKVIVKTMSGVFKSISSALPIIPDEERPRSSSSCDFKVVASQEPNTIPGTKWVDPDRFNFSFKFGSDETDKKSEMEDVMNGCVHVTEREGNGTSSSSSSVNEEHFQDSLQDDFEEGFRDALEVSFLCIPRSEGDGSEETAPPVVEAADSSIPLSAAVLDLAALSASGVESWFRQENIFYLIKVFFGRALEKFLHDEISDLSTEKRWTFYLQMLRESLWPGGEWDTQQVPPPSELQKITTKHQAHQCLIHFFPSFIPAVVGFEEYDQCISEIMDCLQYPELNRHFVYCFIDHMLDKIFPEFESGALHEELLTTMHAGENMHN